MCPRGRVYFLQELAGLVWIHIYDIGTLATLPHAESVGRSTGRWGAWCAGRPEGLAYQRRESDHSPAHALTSGAAWAPIRLRGDRLQAGPHPIS